MAGNCFIHNPYPYENYLITDIDAGITYPINDNPYGASGDPPIIQRLPMIFENGKLLILTNSDANGNLRELRTYSLVGGQYVRESTIPIGSGGISGGPTGYPQGMKHALIRLHNGTIIAMWSQTKVLPTGQYYTSPMFSYRNLAGSWIELEIPDLPNGDFPEWKMQATCVQDDAGGIFAFWKHDTFHKIAAAHLIEDGSKLTVDWVNTNFFPQDTIFAPEGEWPFLIAKPCTNGVMVAYQWNNFVWYSSDPFCKGAYIRVVKVLPSGVKVVVYTSVKDTERIQPFGLSVKNDIPQLVYQVKDDAILAFTKFYLDISGQMTFLGLGQSANEITGFAWSDKYLAYSKLDVTGYVTNIVTIQRQFTPGATKTVITGVTVTPSGLPCQLEVFLGASIMVKAATTGKIDFVSTGMYQTIYSSIVLPQTVGLYHVYVNVWCGTTLLTTYMSPNDVSVE